MNKQRLQELAGINVNELEVNKPMSKTQILNELYGFNAHLLLRLLMLNNSIKELLNEYSSNNLTEFYSEDEYSYEGEYLEKVINLTEKYYQLIKPGDIYLIHKDSEPIPSGYKNIHNWSYETEDDDSNEIFLTKF